MKSVDEIRLLLGKFYEGETSFGEEQLLVDFFATCSDIPDDLKADKAVFAELSEIDMGDNVAIPEGFAEELCDAIEKEIRKQNIKQFKPCWNWSRVAGIVAIVCAITLTGVCLFNQTEHSSGGKVYVPQTEEDAIAVTSKALLLVAEKMNDVNERMTSVSYGVEEINENQDNW